MNSHHSMTIAMEALGAHPSLLAVIVAGAAVIIATVFAIEKRAERSRN